MSLKWVKLRTIVVVVLMSSGSFCADRSDSSATLFEGAYGLPLRGQFNEQYGSGPGIGGGMLSLPGSGMLGLPAESIGMKIVPMISMSETYDTNVYFAPKTPGLKREDFVSTVTPGLSIQRNTASYTATVNGSAVGAYYVNNPQLSYVGFNAGLSIGLTPLVARYSAGSTLSFSYRYRYTPTPPAFLTGAGAAPNTSIPSDASLIDFYTRGLQLGRVNTTSHTATIGGAYQLVPNLSVQGNYSFASMSFGSSPTELQGSGALLPAAMNTITHSASVGPRYNATPLDTVFLMYTYMKSSFDSVVGQSGIQGFASHGLTAGWSKKLSAQWGMTISGGASLVEDQSRGQSNEFLTYNGSGGLNWSRGFTSAGLNYSIGVFPNFINATGPLLSHNISAYANRRLSDEMTATAGLAFSDNSSIGNVGADKQSFRSYSAYATLSYKLSASMFASLNYTYGLFEGAFPSGGSALQSTHFNRQATTLTLVKYFQ